MNPIDMERIIKAIVNWNGKHVEFDKRFLELQDNFELDVKELNGVIDISTKMK